MLDLAAKLGRDKLCGVKVDGLVDRGHDAVFEQALDDLGRRLLHAGGQLADGDLVGDLDDQLRLLGDLELESAHLLLLLGAGLGTEALGLLLLFVLVADLLLAARVVLHALGDKRIDAVVVAVGVDGNRAGINDAAFALALGLRLFGLLGSLRLGVLLRRGSLLGRILRARLILLCLRTGILLRALVVIVLARAVRVRAQLLGSLQLCGIWRALRLGRLFRGGCRRFGFWLFLRLGGREDLGDGADLVLRGDIVEDDVQLIFCQILRTALGLIIKLSDNLNEAFGGHSKIVGYLFDFLLDLNTHTATS